MMQFVEFGLCIRQEDPNNDTTLRDSDFCD